MEQVFQDFPFVVRTRLAELDAEAPAAVSAVLEEHARWVPPPHIHNFPVASRLPFFGRLYDAFLAACREHFEPFTLDLENDRQVWAYVQNEERHSPFWHDHLASSTINGVYYLAVPGGELCLKHLEREWRLLPEQGWLYVFPRWLAHRPAPQSGAAWRISLNVEILSVENPRSRQHPLRW
jgi:hypothetical protein